MPAMRSRFRDIGRRLVEAALLLPVAVVTVLGIAEVNHARRVEAKLAMAATRLASTAGDRTTAVMTERLLLSDSLQLAPAEIDVRIDNDRDEVVISVPYSQAGSKLAFLWDGARVHGGSARGRAG